MPLKDVLDNNDNSRPKQKCQIIPRENGIVRLYVQLLEAEVQGERYDRSQVMLKHIEEASMS
jgi:hypothetical protein